MGCPEPVEDGYEYIAKDCPINDVYGVRSDINFHTGDILEFDIDVDETFGNNDIFRVSENGKGYPAKSRLYPLHQNKARCINVRKT